MIDKKIAYNSLVSAGARIIGLALSLIIIGLITRHLGQEGFGYYATILAFLYFFTVLSDLGLYSICVRDISRPLADKKKIASNAFSLRFFAGLAVFSLAPLTILLFPYPGQVKWGVLIGALAFWLMSNQQVLMGIFQKYLRMDKVALAELLGRLIQLGLVFFFIKLGLGFFSLLWAMAVGSLISFGLTFLFSRRYVKVGFDFDFSFWRRLLQESVPLALAIIFTAVYFKMDTLMLSVMRPPGEVGIYNLAYKFLESLLFFPAMFVGLIVPLMSRYAFTNREKFYHIFQKGFNLLALFIVPLAVGTFFISKELVVLVGGREFIASASVLNILVVAASVIFLAVLFSNTIISFKKQKILTYFYGLGALINLAANLLLIPRYSYFGAAFTTLFTELIVTFLMLVVVRRLLGRLPSLVSLLKYFGAGAIMALFIWSGLLNNPWVAVFSGGAVYFIVLYLMGVFSIKKDLLPLIRKDVV